jgi:hypothetical protein
MPITESGITLNFPDNNYFRFEDCQGYKEIQNNFKEMDVCWYEQATDTLYIIELKDWHDGKLIEENDPSFSAQKIIEMKQGISKSNRNILVKKSIDSASMFLSILLEKPYSPKIQLCAPFIITNTTSIKLLSIINWTNPDVTYVATINTEYRSKFASYAKLFDIKAYVVMTKDKATQVFDWIT